MKKNLIVKNININFFSQKEADFISLTDIARCKDSRRTDYIIQNWMRMRSTIEFLGLWEKLNNSDFKPIEFDGFRFLSGLNSFSLTPKRWIENTNAIGVISQSERLLKLNQIAIIQMRSLLGTSRKKPSKSK